MIPKQKIAIVCGHFMPEVGYVEVQLAKAFSRLGQDVHVFTSTLIPSAIKNKLPKEITYQEGTTNSNDYFITRLTPYFSLGQMVKCKGLLKNVAAFQPDMILIIGLGKLFPKPVLKHPFLSAKKIVLLADNEDSFDYFSGAKGKYNQIKKLAIRKLFKDAIYKIAVKKANQFFAYTPSAPDVVLNYLPKKLHTLFLQKVAPLSLGFDEQEFYFDKKIRLSKRKEMNFSDDDVVLITATRITAFKNLEQIIDVVDKINSEETSLKYIIAGFGNDVYSEKLKNYIASKKHADQFLTLPFLAHHELLKLYHAADLGYWSSHIITHYEAMGTGLPIILPDKKNIQHIIEQDINGWKFKKTEIYAIFTQATSQIHAFRTKRKMLAETAKLKFAFTIIAQKIL